MRARVSDPRAGCRSIPPLLRWLPGHFLRMTCNHSSDFGGGPILDPETLRGLGALAGEDDPDLIPELIDLFLEDAVDRLDSMTAGAGSGDVGTVAQAAHALKSASANVGALAFSERCSEIEAVARDRGPVRDLVSACNEMFVEVRGAMQSFRSARV